jgi:hypothetical protein
VRSAIPLLIAVIACGPSAAPPTAELPTWFGAVDQPPRRIAGQLLDGERPITGVVHLRADLPDPTVWAGRDVATGDDGRFDFGELRAGRYHILATAPGRVSRVISVDTRATAASELPVYAYPCTVLAGTVIAQNAGPIAGAALDVRGVAIGHTGFDGSFQLCTTYAYLPVTVRAAGYTPRSEGLSRQWPRPIELQRAIELRARVVDERGKPLARVGVQPVLQHDRELDIQATTDADGRVVIPGVPGIYEVLGRPALYTVRVIDHDRAFDAEDAAVGNAAAVIVVRGGGRIVEQSTRDVNATIRGRVVHDGKPVPDAAIWQMKDATNPVVYTRRDGAFDLAVDARGPVLLGMHHATGLATSRVVEISPGQQLTGVAIDVAERTQIAGVVVDASGHPLADRRVQARARDTATGKSTYTDSDGTFVLDVEACHTYDLRASNGAIGVSVTTEVRVDRAATGIRLVLDGPRIFELVAVDTAGAPVRDATVLTTQEVPTVLPDGSRKYDHLPWVPRGASGSGLYAQATPTDASGRAHWSPHSDGPYGIVLVARDGRIGALAGATTESSPARVTMERPGSIKLTCAGSHELDSISIVSGSLRFDAGCGQTITDLPRGHYVVSGKAEKFEFARTEVDVRAGAAARAVVQVMPPGTIRGTVLLDDGTPASGIECDAGIFDGKGFADGDPGAITAADGTFALTISRGAVGVRCRDPYEKLADVEVPVTLAASARVTIRMKRAELRRWNQF